MTWEKRFLFFQSKPNKKSFTNFEEAMHRAWTECGNFLAKVFFNLKFIYSQLYLFSSILTNILRLKASKLWLHEGLKLWWEKETTAKFKINNSCKQFSLRNEFKAKASSLWTPSITSDKLVYNVFRFEKVLTKRTYV